MRCKIRRQFFLFGLCVLERYAWNNVVVVVEANVRLLQIQN